VPGMKNCSNGCVDFIPAGLPFTSDQTLACNQMMSPNPESGIVFHVEGQYCTNRARGTRNDPIPLVASATRMAGN
jgi:hypothetical protein